nr:MAG TPA: replication protein O [Caudoviricetes sp.]
MPPFKRPGRYTALAGGYYDDPAVIAAGPEAELLYIRLLSWCALHPETDGAVPVEVATSRLGLTAAAARLDALTTHGLVTADATTITVTSWVRWNGSWGDITAKSDARKAAARERKARQRARAAQDAAEPAPVPDPTPTATDDDSALEATIIADEPGDRPDVEAICAHMADSVADRTGRRPRITKKWRDAARLMIDRDGRTPDQIHAAIDWVARSEFWRSNILGVPKLREKWDTLKLQAERGQRPHVTRAEEFRARQRANAAEIDAAWAAQPAEATILTIEGTHE